ncbi:pyruvate dehydrogenase phosphatase regulatory subunit, mitochondrial-like [Dysidea avara]|uniref:pyruvate dehydrogenase phosphatase regulatory subunit, mitochondrial-like n=1 Tax=Dysidea avara TaxID=196820 RepID=UPI00331FA4D8
MLGAVITRLRCTSLPLGLRNTIRSYRTFPDQCQVVVCGGGVVGCSVAYHLTKLGWTDVVVLEQGSISSGSTWHAAGLFTQLKATESETKLATYGHQLIPKIEEETGVSTSWKQCGSVMIARTKDRMKHIRRAGVFASVFGIENYILSPEECYKKWPHMKYDDIQGGLWIPGDGTLGPSDLCQAFAKGATQKGVKIVEKVTVDKVLVSNDRVCGVRTNQGDVKCEVFVNCAGQWARDLGKLSNPKVKIPLHSTEHYYLVSKPFKDAVDSMLPGMRDPDGHLYAREWSGGILVGIFEPVSKPIFTDGVPTPFEYQLLPEDWDHLQQLIDEALYRIPALETVEIRQIVNGPESFTPDTLPLLGEAPEVRNYFVAAGFNSVGIMSSSGVGHVLSEWIVNGSPPYDLHPFDIKRVGSHDMSKRFLHDRAVEIIGRKYAVAYPKMEYNFGRNIKCSPLHSTLDKAGANWEAKMGWERPSWFTRSPDESREFVGTFGKPNWFDNVCEEHTKCRNEVCVFDMTSFAKFEVEGDNVVEIMQMLCSNNVDVPVGKIVYTGMLNERGGYETDCTVTRTAPNKYFVVGPAAQATHVASWISKNLPSSVQLRDVTSQYTVLAVMGPHSRKLLEQVTSHPLDNDDFPFGTSQVIEIGYVPSVRASRVSYVGELGWELYVPNEYSYGLYNKLFSVYGIHPHNGGFYAVDSLRIEKAYRHWGGEVDTTITPWEAGLGFTVNMKKDNFVGKQALIRQKKEGIKQRVAIFTLQEFDMGNLMWGGEAIVRNDKIVGYLTSAAYGYSIGRPVGMGLVRNPGSNGELLPVTKDYILNANYQINIAGVVYPANVSLSAAYDPNVNYQINIADGVLYPENVSLSDSYDPKPLRMRM